MESTAGAMDYTMIPTGRSILLRQNEPRSHWISAMMTSCNTFACAKHFILSRAGLQNNAWLKPVRSAEEAADFRFN